MSRDASSPGEGARQRLAAGIPSVERSLIVQCGDDGERIAFISDKDQANDYRARGYTVRQLCSSTWELVLPNL